jgi:hypothetical protein
MNVSLKSEKLGTHEWPEFKPNKMMSTEAEAIEGVTSMTFVQWGQALLNGNALCGRALVWVLLKRQNPNLRFKHVDFPIDELSVELDNDEKAKIRAELRTNDDLSDEDKKQIMLALGEDDLDQLDFEPTDDDSAESPGNSRSAVESDAG